MALKRNAIIFLTFLIAVAPPSATAYLSPSVKDHFFSDALLRELVDRMGKDLADAADSYIDPLPVNDQLALMARASKDLEAEQMDYDALLDGNPSPSLRDQEYLQHSTLWGHQYMSGGAGEGPHRVKPQVKTDATLPAYCNPPNPCPVGYTEDQGCQLDFENTASFSREYQAAQECMCDGEHMFDCPGQDQGENRQMDSDIESFLAQQFHTQEHKNLVAKKFHSKKSSNPYLEGEKLPVAAKKGNRMVY
ncbi:neuroendocrine protein 7B2 isoform X2 [Phlebotomus papatasi]|uniref:neuroendocrine protein 7B2 isoform X2 n=1 Tax=Phlebotomus papatasi TaxID=29031 RepID=UPI002484129F|nr:neuroendocrine protein 7B2 isoform X2 [Phlebotomus papatasi]XP_055708889.1 neuroendocrine protein 7B2 isoform X2 [Phlebotomus papatasi]XP_055708890.1 neuroendocrine protein 7B2 isoform X2 [Phlebotomus papatasi]